MSTPALPRAHGQAALSATIRQDAEDFRVDELDAFAPSGSGEHLLLTIEKRGMNTAFVARLLAQWAGVDERAVGYAGLKDRHALTTQRFTVQLPGREDPDIAALEAMGEGAGQGLRVLATSRHARKLPRGALAGNRFALTLRDVAGDRATIESRLRAIAAEGVPNYFGEQRFGHGGGNVDKALAFFAAPRRRLGREQRALLLSSARSALFNQVLAARVTAGTWATGCEGEVWMLDGSRSLFGPEPWSEALAVRAAAHDIHPTGPLWGRGETRAVGAAREIEMAALADARARALREGLERAGLSQERRATRLLPGTLAWAWQGEAVLQLAFALPPGCYATAVLAELGTIANAAAPRSLPAAPAD
ncbi:tRNA pseudouridine(13) synthase TruD [Luteimonas sp. TWI662]|uniref:tRNA pseudouridine(13) synthase TruD n=1 Tax=Luteimonas sp. TWI662 TaxID=3136789 RepID=UPI00320AA0A0